VLPDTAAPRNSAMTSTDELLAAPFPVLKSLIDTALSTRNYSDLPALLSTLALRMDASSSPPVEDVEDVVVLIENLCLLLPKEQLAKLPPELLKMAMNIRRQAEVPEPPAPTSGVTNLGNTCWMTSFLIALCANFSIVMAALDKDLKANPGNGVAKALRDTLLQMKEAGKAGTVHNPRVFLRAVRAVLPKYSDGGEHDAADFLTDVLNFLPNVKLLYSFGFTETKTCRHCCIETTVHTKEVVLLLRHNIGMSFQDAVEQLAVDALIDGATCSYCGVINSTYHKFKVYNLPVLLAVQRSYNTVAPEPFYISSVATARVGQSFYQLKAVSFHVPGASYRSHYLTGVYGSSSWMLHDDARPPSKFRWKEYDQPRASLLVFQVGSRIA